MNIKYSDLFQARRQAGKLPTMVKERPTDQQRLRRREGRCIECGDAPQLVDSLICRKCYESLSMNAIRQDIESIRKRILSDPS